MAAAVVGDAAVAVRGQEEHLVFEGVRAQRPAVAEDHGLPGAPVLVIDLVPSLVVIVAMLSFLQFALEMGMSFSALIRAVGVAGGWSG